MLVTCSNCGKSIERKIRDMKRNRNHFCCKKCEGEFRQTHPTKKVTENNLKTLGDTTIIYIKYKNQEYECLIDTEDIPKIKGKRWFLRVDSRNKKRTKYVETFIQINKKHKRIHLHRLLTNCPENMVVDHLNGNALDNRKSNLKVCTQQENTLNRHLNFKGGVYFNKRENNWIAKISIQGITYYLGYYKTEEEALNRRQIANQYILEGNIEAVKNMKCECLKDRRRLNHIYKTPSGKYQVRFENPKFFKLCNTEEEAIKVRDKFKQDNNLD